VSIYAIYKITNLVNQKVYIGQTQRRPSSRYANHCSAARNGSSNLLHSAIRKYGEENFSFEVLDLTATSAKELDQLEVNYVSKFKSYVLYPDSNGYNMTIGGSGRYGAKHFQIPINIPYLRGYFHGRSPHTTKATIFRYST
jgi:group I intron endonuclease